MVKLTVKDFFDMTLVAEVSTLIRLNLDTSCFERSQLIRINTVLNFACIYLRNEFDF